MVNLGKVRAIAVTSSRRSPLLPALPTMEEAGVHNFEAVTYTGVFLPAATPRDIVSRVTAAVLKALDMPSTRDTFTRLGAEVIKSTPEELTQRLSTDFARWKKVAQQTGITLD
jgi:tripartite-type tricarboxylate transporter receptor subunit TctC